MTRGDLEEVEARLCRMVEGERKAREGLEREVKELRERVAGLEAMQANVAKEAS